MHSVSNNKGKRATLKDVCREASVSKATVSRVINNKACVSAKIRATVLSAIKKLNYTPLATARDLSRSKRDTLGIVFQDLTAGFLLTVFRGVMHVAAGTGYNVITALSTTDEDEYALPKRLLGEGRVDGLIWLDPRLSSKTIGQIKECGIPFVLIQRDIGDPDINSISIENTHGAYLACSHLLKLGRRRLLFVTGPENNEDSRERLAGAKQALAEFNVPFSPDKVLVGHHVGPHAVKAFSDYLAQGHPLPDAIFAFNDNMAIALLQWMKKTGIRVPKDVALVGFDGIEESEYLGLTTVETPMYEVGTLAAQILLDSITDPSGQRKARQIILRGHLRVRETCGAGLKTIPAKD